MELLLAGSSVGLGVGLLGWAHRRAHGPLPEAVPHRRIAELEEGRFRVAGRVVAEHVTPSPLDGADCVFFEHAEYRMLGSEAVPLMRQVDHRIVAHPFVLDDGTGRLRVDPAETDVEAVTLTEDHGLFAERRLRAGEEVELVASFRPRAVEREGGPYRGRAVAWEAHADHLGRPRLSYRTEPGMMRPIDEASAFLRGAGALLVFAGTAFGLLATVF